MFEMYEPGPIDDMQIWTHALNALVYWMVIII